LPKIAGSSSKNNRSSSKRGVFEEELPKNNRSSSKRGVFEDELPKNAGSSSKTGLNEEELPKIAGLPKMRGEATRPFAVRCGGRRERNKERELPTTSGKRPGTKKAGFPACFFLYPEPIQNRVIKGKEKKGNGY